VTIEVLAGGVAPLQLLLQELNYQLVGVRGLHRAVVTMIIMAQEFMAVGWKSRYAGAAAESCGICNTVHHVHISFWQFRKRPQWIHGLHRPLPSPMSMGRFS
jgi:hypothetical protein